MILTPGNNQNQKTVVIVGVQRGGTSMVAGVVRELGINLGKNLGNNHEDPEFLTKDLSKIREVIGRRNANYDVWGWKMPHSSEYISELLPDLRNPHVVIVFRNLLAMAESQLKRSETDFAKAFQFSLNRLGQVGSVVNRLSCPLMLVNYEQATAKPHAFIDELCAFLNLSPSEEARGRAERMIDPEIGYRRLSSEEWRNTVVKLENFDLSTFTEAQPKRRDINLARADGRLQRAGDRPIVEFSGLVANKYVLTLIRDSEPTNIRVAVDVGNGYSANMADNISLYRGGNALVIEAEQIRGLHIYPQFDGIWSNIRQLRVFVAE